MNKLILTTTLTLAAAAPFSMHAEDSQDTLNRWSLGPRIGLNFKADFHNNATFNPGPAAGGADHAYNDGYVNVDSSGNAGGLSWNWGYQNSAQVVGDTQQFHALQSTDSSITDNPQYGAEIIYQRVIGRFLSAGTWGLESAFGYTDIDMRNNCNGTVGVTTDSYALNGVLSPSAGYNGTFQGPGALLGDSPTRSFESASLSSNQKLSGSLFSFRLGPYAEWNFTEKLSFAASVGLTLAPTKLDYNFSETATLANGETFSQDGSSSRTKLLYGPYVGGTLNYAFTKHWGVYVGAQFQNLTDLEQSVGTHTPKFDPGATVYATLGTTWSF